MRRFGDFAADNLLKGIEAVALGVESVHEMHDGGGYAGSSNGWVEGRWCFKNSSRIFADSAHVKKSWDQKLLAFYSRLDTFTSKVAFETVPLSYLVVPHHHFSDNTTTMLPLTILLLCWVVPAMSQFFNFGNMFNQQQQQEPQNMASDSEWYQQQHEAGMYFSWMCVEV